MNVTPDIRVEAEATKMAVDDQLGIGASLPLTDIFVVEDGVVEVYMTLPHSRRFIAEFGTGALLFGAAGSEGLIVFAPDGARLSRVSASALVDAANAPATRGALVTAVEAWVDGVSAGLARAESNRPEVKPQRAGERAQVAAGDALTSSHGVVWLDGGAGTGLKLLGQGPGANHLLPVSTAIWATVDADAEIATYSTAAFLEREWPKALAAYAVSAAGVVRAIAERDRAGVAERFARQQTLTAEGITAANRQFVDVLSVGARHEMEAVDDLDYAIDMLAGTTGQPAMAPAATRRKLPFEMQLDLRGQRGRSVTLTGDWWSSDRGPLLGYLAEGHKPVALVPDWRGRYILKERGQRPRRLDAKAAALLERRAYVLVPTMPNRPMKLRDLTMLAFALCRIEFGTIALVSLLAALIGLLVPIATRTVVDTFIPDGLSSGLVLLGVVLVIANISVGLLRTASDFARLRMDGKLAVAVLSGVVDRVLRMPSRVLRMQSSADLALRVLSMDRMRRTLSAVGTGLIVSSVTSICTLGLLIFYAPIAAAASVAIFIVFLVISVLAGLAQNKAIATGEAMTANLSSLTLQIVQNMPMVRAFGAERRAYVQWGRNAAAQRARSLRSRLAAIRYTTFVAAYDGLALAAIFVLLGYTSGGNKTTIGTYIAFVITYQQFLAASEGIGSALVQLITTRPLLKRAALILDTAPETAPFARDPGTLSGAVELSSVSYRHDPNGPLVVDDVSLRIEPGQFVALTGPSGSGKTTIVNLILGFEVPESGSVLISGVDLGKLDKTSVRRQIGIVAQNGRLMPGSIFENLTGLHDGKLEDAWQAAELAGIADDIRALPMGMHTLINEGASTLSGGQVQRLLLARALIAKPRLLLLDEATSALDGRTQASVMANIEKLGVSRLVIAHRLGTVRNADVIHFVVGGKIVQSGHYEELMQADGPFAAFAHRQAVS